MKLGHGIQIAHRQAGLRIPAMEMEMKIAIGVFSDDDQAASRDCVESINEQIQADGLEVDIFVLANHSQNSYSTINKLPNVTVISFDNQNPSAAHHFHALSSHTNEHDWVWVIDAKYSLYSKATLKFLAETLQGLKREEVELVCVGIEGRTFDTGAIEAHPLTTMCNAHGFYDILGDPSALVVRRHAFQTAFGENFQKMSEIAASGYNTNKLWWHSKLLFMALHSSNSAYVDRKILCKSKFEAATDEQFDEISPLKSEHISELANDLIELNFAVGEQVLWSPKFFRIKQETIWYFLALQQHKRAIAFTETREADQDQRLCLFDDIVANWQMMLALTDMVGNGKVKETLNQLIVDGIRHTMTLHQERVLSDSAKRYFDNCTAVTKIFSSTILESKSVAEGA